ncbi:hypothetical protein MVEN_02423600 [Mycena venus]|uniref:Translation initiation factor 3 N-terminal domain-containing protein n=1 Tax=Mycena venus TaxID=2733690 RepID=A0A8H6WY55_9AGAR|nr:hypothetical protein MVEN_02423600 [Mycena venus]
MNTFSAFRLAARTLLRPGRHPAHFPCLDRVHVRFLKQKARATRLRDEHIPYAEVSLVEDDNTLVKTSLKRLLKSVNRKEEWVELVAETPEPVVKIINKKEAIATQKKAKERQREVARKNIVKEVQLTWGSEQGDLEHKITRIRSYLEMGAKVDIVFSTKSNKGSPPPVKAQQAKVQSTIDDLADISKEWKPVEWRKNMAAIFLRGIVDEGRKLTSEQMKLAEEEGIGEAEPVELDESEGEPETAPAHSTPPPPPPRLSPQPAQPEKPKDLGFTPPLPPPLDPQAVEYLPIKRRNPLSGMKKEKKYGKRSVG